MDSRPGWATIVGIIFLLFGGCGAVNNIKMVQTDAMVKMTDEIISNIEKNEREQEPDSLDVAIIDMMGDTITRDTSGQMDIKSTLARLMYMTDYYKKWAVIMGWVGLVIALFFLISGSFFFSQKAITIKLSIATLLLAIIFGGLKIYVFSQDDSSPSIINAIKFSSAFSMFLNVILLTVILVCDKTYYLGDPDAEY